MEAVTNLLVTILRKDFSSDNLESIFKVKHCTLTHTHPHSHTHLHTLTQHLEVWTQSENEAERTRSMACVLALLKAYNAHAETNEACRELAVQGHLLGRMVPRCSDPLLFVRQTAIDCIQLTLKIATSVPGEWV